MTFLRRLFLATCLLGLTTPSWAVLSAADVWEVRASGASDNNGGAFKAGATGTDRSQQNAAQVAIDNSVITTSIAANVITFTGYSPSAADVGNVVHMLTGTNVTAGFYEITAQTGSTWTVTGAAALPTSGTTTNATGNMGGAIATLGMLSGTNAMVASNKAFLVGAFTSTTTNTFAQTAAPTGAVPRSALIGYTTTRGDGGRATLTITGGSLTGIACTGNGWDLQNLFVDCNAQTTSVGISVASTSSVFNCKVANFTSKGIASTANPCLATVVNCEVTGGTAGSGISANGASSGLMVSGCYVHDNTCTGILGGVTPTITFNIVANDTGTVDGITAQSGETILNNTVFAVGRHGINITADGQHSENIRNNLLVNCGGFGLVVNSTAIAANPLFDGNAYFNNTSGNRSNGDSVTGIYGVSPYTNVHDITATSTPALTASPFVGPTTGGTANFALNNTPGGGASVRAAGLPAAFPGLATTVSKLDAGAVQSQAVGSPPQVITAP